MRKETVELNYYKGLQSFTVSFKVLLCFLAKHLGAIHMETLLFVNARFASFWPIAHMDPVNVLSWNLVSGFKNPSLRSRVDSESAYFAYRWRHCPTPWPLNPMMSHNNNNNNGGLHACVRAAEDIEPLAKSYLGKILCSSATTLSEKVLWTTNQPFLSSSRCVWFLLLSVCTQWNKNSVNTTSSKKKARRGGNL